MTITNRKSGCGKGMVQRYGAAAEQKRGNEATDGSAGERNGRAGESCGKAGEPCGKTGEPCGKTGTGAQAETEQENPAAVQSRFPAYAGCDTGLWRENPFSGFGRG